MTGRSGLLGGASRKKLDHRRSLRLLTALEVLQVRREAAQLCRSPAELALCHNACLLARALEKGHRPVYKNGQEVLEHLTPGEIEELTAQWSAFNRSENPSPEDGRERLEALKKVWSTRRVSAFGGVCSKVWGYFRFRRSR